MKKYTAILLTVMIIITLFSGCKAKNKSEDVTINEEATETSEQIKEEVERIVFVCCSLGEVSPDLEMVNERLNEMTREAINVEADIQLINIATYMQQLNVMLAGGDPVDLMFLLAPKEVMISQNQLMPVGQYIDKYGAHITESLGGLIDYGKVNGDIYAIPFNSSKVYPTAIVARKDLLEKYNLSLDDVDNYKDLADIYEVIQTNEPEMICLAPNSNDVLTGYAMGDKIDKIDILGDGIGVIMGNDNYDVVNLYKTDEYKDIIETMRQWYLKGYIMKDAATTSEVGNVMYNQGKLFSYFYVDVLDDLDNSYQHMGISGLGQETMVKALNNPMITASSGFYSVGISSQSTKAEAAIKWLDNFYHNEEAINTLYYGIEGKHYLKNEDGTISYPEGMNMATCGYNTPFNWAFGNTEYSYVFQDTGYPADYSQTRIKQNNNVEYSNAFGFVFDPTSVKSEYSAVTNVINQYKRALESGSVDPEAELPIFIDKLNEAGIDTVIEEKQRQLDAWVEGQ